MEYPFKKEESEALPPLLFNEKPELKLIDEIEVIACLKCEKSYEFPKFEDDYLAHLFLEHRLVIADVSDIADLKDYLKYWTQRFKEKEFEEYCTTLLLDQLPDGSPAKNEKYYLLSDVLPQDYDIRKQLQEQRLKKALTRHQFERTDREFQKECLYCRDVIKGLRAAYLEHLFIKHFLQLGKPENLVYVDELIAKVQLNLEQLVCLYCEKVFKDRIALKDHMRKKGHKRINPNNPNYDKYFLINYRTEKPKTAKSINKNIQEKPRRQKSDNQKQGLVNESTLHTQLEHPKEENLSSNHKVLKEDSSVDFNKHFSNSDEGDSDWSDWDCEEQPLLNCLYCTHKEPEFILLKTHMLTEHNMDFDACVQSLNFYQKVKIINYVRRQICFRRCVICNNRYDSVKALLEHMSAEKHFGVGTKKQWDRPEYFFPTYDDDGVLCVLDDNPTDNIETVVRIISEDSSARINKDAENLSLENFQYL